MNAHLDLQTSVRRELGLEAPARPRRRSPLLGLAAATALLSALAAGPAVAQGPYQQERLPGFSSLVVGSSSSPELGDLDGDGDFDLVIGRNSEGPVFFENVGTGSPAFVQKTGSASPLPDPEGFFPSRRSRPALADLDGDGDLDLTVGYSYGDLAYFANTGTPTAARFVQRFGSANPFLGMYVGMNVTPDLVDLDSDGDFDLVLGVGDILMYFENTGTASTPAFLERTASANPFGGIDAGSNSAPKLVDLDSDGDFDTVVGASDGSLRFFENTGAANAPAFLERTGAGNPLLGFSVRARSTPTFADLNADSLVDAVVGGIDGGFKYLENTGSGSVPAFVERTGSAGAFDGTDVGRWSTPELVDLDNDGDADAVFGEYSGGFLYFENTGGAVAPAFLARTGSANPLGTIDVGTRSHPKLTDLDADGDLDAMLGDNFGFLRYAENTGHPGAPAFVEQTGSANPFDGFNAGNLSAPELADLDGDGDLDAVVGEYAGRLHFLDNSGGTSAPSFVERTGAANPFNGIDIGRRSSPDLADADGDGDLDAVVGESAAAMFYFERQGDGTFLERTGGANPVDQIDAGFLSAPELVDIDGDGDLDLFVGESEGRILFFRSLHVLFADGFESEDTSAWSLTVPGL